ncbi:rhomboid family intramembrane serine protease [Corynebacterium spheniscorum]|uniref:Membrane associated serine protease, rhomboid family n=1 Tax=Corynebacterium spheniscorum TaxID=185761 RepID=A0A1I2VD40_9CORY|nr:rhomboid family intramembrane serine protease [Corynebacterium spheniscorum]KAA8720428.1 rhomboid family intramembrane serine protease [Corynebacterium spheniscorum]SFG86379.1 Membrane associated serine protease, rhomboid family [Corynebacterium spheniscorum]
MDALTAWFRRWSHDAPATLSFAAIACLLWLATAIESRSFQHSLHDSRIGDHAILYGVAIPSDPFGPLRALSAIFLHLSISHLFVNLFLLMLIGRELERFYGHRLFAALFLIGGLGSSAAILWMAPTTPTAGASGAVYALMVVLVGLAAITKADLRAPLTLLLVNIAYTFIDSSVSLWGHLGGALTGCLLVAALTRRNPRTYLAALSILILAAILFQCFNLGWSPSASPEIVR